MPPQRKVYGTREPDCVRIRLQVFAFCYKLNMDYIHDVLVSLIKTFTRDKKRTSVVYRLK